MKKLQEREEKLMLKSKNGITLIALVITIIVLLILAGVSISLVIGDNGVLTEAQNAIEETRKATAKEEVELAWASLESEYWTKWAQNSATTRASVFTQANMEKYLTGKGTVGSFTYTEGGTSTITYTSNAEPNESDSYVISSTGEVSEAPVSQAEWEIVTDSGTTGLSIGDLVRPTVTGVTSEQFYVIGKDDTAGTVTLLAEKNVKTNDTTAANNIQSSSANTVAFDRRSNVYYDGTTNPVTQASIKGLVDAYVSILTGAGLTLEDVELVEGGSPVSGAKGRLMWGTATGSWNNDYTVWTYTSGTGEVGALLDSNLTNKTDIVYGPSTARLIYWLGSPLAGSRVHVWVVFGNSSSLDRDNTLGGDIRYGLRPVIKILQSKF